MVDANQAWDLHTAKRMAIKLEKFPLSWLEEPLQADRPQEEWICLARSTSLPLATGENLRGEINYSIAINSKCFKVIQPDVCKCCRVPIWLFGTIFPGVGTQLANDDALCRIL